MTRLSLSPNPHARAAFGCCRSVSLKLMPLRASSLPGPSKLGMPGTGDPLVGWRLRRGGGG